MGPLALYTAPLVRATAMPEATPHSHNVPSHTARLRLDSAAAVTPSTMLLAQSCHTGWECVWGTAGSHPRLRFRHAVGSQARAAALAPWTAAEAEPATAADGSQRSPGRAVALPSTTQRSATELPDPPWPGSGQERSPHPTATRQQDHPSARLRNAHGPAGSLAHNARHSLINICVSSSQNYKKCLPHKDAPDVRRRRAIRGQGVHRAPLAA